MKIEHFGNFFLIERQKFYFFFNNGPTPASFIGYFLPFQANIISIFITNICEKCPSSIWCRDSNPRPLERESTPVTTKPGLPPRSSTSYGVRVDLHLVLGQLGPNSKKLQPKLMPQLFRVLRLVENLSGQSDCLKSA